MNTVYEVYFDGPCGPQTIKMYSKLAAAKTHQADWNMSHGSMDQAKIATHEVHDKFQIEVKKNKPIGHTRGQFDEMFGYKISDATWEFLKKEYNRQLTIVKGK